MASAEPQEKAGDPVRCRGNPGLISCNVISSLNEKDFAAHASAQIGGGGNSEEHILLATE